MQQDPVLLSTWAAPNFLQAPRKVVILGTGGTIAGRASSAGDNIGYRAGEVGIDEVVETIPELSANGLIVTEQVAQVDSKDITFAIWRQLALRVDHFLSQEDVQGIVITHGTDTLEETAFFLQSVCQYDKPVVLTCAMRPATARQPDGPQNVLDAVTTARWPGATGVLVVCAGRIHSAQDVQKVHTYRLDAFDSGEAGVIGFIEENCLRLVRNWPVAQAKRARAAIKYIADDLNAADWPRVEIIMNYAGASGAIVDALRAQGIDGLVVAATGNGTLHTDLELALLAAKAAGVKVVRATRCVNGRIFPRPDDSLPDSNGLSPAKARVAMLLELMGESAGGGAVDA
jgi:L-asparaginase